MSVRTNRVQGELTSASDINAIAVMANASEEYVLAQGFNARTGPLEFIAHLHPQVDYNVMQSFGKDELTGEWYVAQARGGTDPQYENLVISRLSPAGALISSMTLENCAHGTNIGVQRDGTTIWIWTAWRKPVFADGYSNARIAYAGGTTKTYSQATIFAAMGQNYAIPAIDQQKGLVAWRDITSSQERFTLRKISDVVAGNDIQQGAVIGPFDTSLYGIQGFATDETYCYRWTGNSSAKIADLYIYKWSDGSLVEKRSFPYMAMGVDGKFSGDYREPEGACIYRDPLTGRKALILGCVTGPSGLRLYKTYGIYEPGSPRLSHPEIETVTTVPRWQPLTLASGFVETSQSGRPEYRVWPYGRIEFRGSVGPDPTANYPGGINIVATGLPIALNGARLNYIPVGSSLIAGGPGLRGHYDGSTGTLKIYQLSGSNAYQWADLSAIWGELYE